MNLNAIDSMNLHNIGSYVRRTDPERYRQIVSIIGPGKQTTRRVGAYVEMTDPEMTERIINNC